MALNGSGRESEKKWHNTERKVKQDESETKQRETKRLYSDFPFIGWFSSIKDSAS